MIPEEIFIFEIISGCAKWPIYKSFWLSQIPIDVKGNIYHKDTFRYMNVL